VDGYGRGDTYILIGGRAGGPVAVQTGEGTIEIIYGSLSIPAGAVTLGGYLARPDGIGEWPTVLMFGPESAPRSSVKNICRIFARHGFAALAPELTDDHRTNRLIASSVAGFIGDPSGDWSNAQFGYGALAFGPGIYDVSAAAADDGLVSALAMVGGTIDEVVKEDLDGVDVPILFIGSRADVGSDIDGSLEAKTTLARITYVLYRDAEAGWWDDDADGFDEQRARDTMDRMIVFFGEQLPPRV